MYPKEQERKW